MNVAGWTKFSAVLAILLSIAAFVPLLAHAQAGDPVTHTEIVPILLSVVGALGMGLCSLFGGIVLSKANGARESADDALGVANEALRLVSRFEGLLSGHTARLAHIEQMLRDKR